MEKDWFDKAGMANTAVFRSDEEAVQSETAIFDFFDKCIIPFAEINKILVVSV